MGQAGGKQQATSQAASNAASSWLESLDLAAVCTDDRALGLALQDSMHPLADQTFFLLSVFDVARGPTNKFLHLGAPAGSDDLPPSCPRSGWLLCNKSFEKDATAFTLVPVASEPNRYNLWSVHDGVGGWLVFVHDEIPLPVHRDVPQSDAIAFEIVRKDNNDHDNRQGEQCRLINRSGKFSPYCELHDGAVSFVADSEAIDATFELKPCPACSNSSETSAYEKAYLQHGEQEIITWLTGSRPHSPAAQAVALVRACASRYGSGKRGRLRALFGRMCKATIFKEHKEMEKLSAAKKSKSRCSKVEGGATGVAQIAVRFAVKMMLEQGADGVALQMLLDEMAAGAPLGRLPLCERDAPSMLLAASEAAAEVCLRVLHSSSSSGRAPVAAHLLLRLALLGGSVQNVLAAVQWLLKEDSELEADMAQQFWQISEEIHSVWAPWELEFLQERKWKRDSPGAALRCIKPLSAAADLNLRGAYLEVTFLRDSGNCVVCLVPNGADALNTGVGIASSGEAWCKTGDLSPYTPFTEALSDGDIIGLWLQGGGVQVFVNGGLRGRLPQFDAIFAQGCHAVVSGLGKTTEVVLNVGQVPFAFHPNDAASWLSAAGGRNFAELKSCASRPHVRRKQETEKERLAIAYTLLGTLDRNQALCSELAETHQTFESLHPYLPNMRQEIKMSFPGARKIRIHFDDQCCTEEGCDVLRFFREAGHGGQVGIDYSGRNWPSLEIEDVETLWYFFASDSSREEWGFKFTVTPEYPDGQGIPFCIEHGKETLTAIVNLLQHHGIKQMPAIASGALANLAAKHVELAHEIEPSICTIVSSHLLKLMESSDADVNEDRNEVATHAANAFRQCCARLFTALDLIRLQLTVWNDSLAGQKAKGIIEIALVSCTKTYSSISDEPEEALPVLHELCSKALAAGNADHTARAVRLLRRILQDLILHAVVKQSANSWHLVLVTARDIFAYASKAPDNSSIATSLLLPLMHGFSAVSAWAMVPWESLAALLPPLGTLARNIDVSAGGVLGELRTAVLALVAAIGRAMVQLGLAGCPVKKEDCHDTVLRSPLIRVVPSSALTHQAPELPAGMHFVEEMIQTRLLDAEEVSELGFSEASPPLPSLASTEVFQEFLGNKTPRAQALTQKLINEAGPCGYQKVFSERIQLILFCVLVKHHCLEYTLELVLQQEETAKLCDKVLAQLWIQANRLKLGLMSMQQRLSAQGRSKEHITANIEHTLEFLLACGEAGSGSGESITDNESFEAILERQNTPLDRGMAEGEAEVMPGVQDMRRVRLLMKSLPMLSGKVTSSYTEAIHDLFLGKWFTEESPLENLLQHITAVSIAAWHRAAGFSLLGWAVEQCAAGSGEDVTATAVNALSEAWQLEARAGLRASAKDASLALVAGRSRAIRALVALLNARREQDVGALTTQVVALGALAGPWRSDDHQLVVASGMLDAIRPYLPWHRAASVGPIAAEGTLVHAAMLSFESLAALGDHSDSSKHVTPVSRLLLQDLLQKLHDIKGFEKASGLESAVSLMDIFGTGAIKPKERQGLVADLRWRLESGQDFGGLETQDFEPFLRTMSDLLAKWLQGKASRYVEALDADVNSQQQEDSAETEGEINTPQSWREFDIDKDGQVDEYEFLQWALQQHVDGNLVGTKWSVFDKTFIGCQPSTDLPSEVRGTQRYNPVELMEGQQQFHDRDYKLRNVMADLVGLTLFQGPCLHETGDEIHVMGEPSNAAYICVSLGNPQDEVEQLDSLLSESNWFCVQSAEMSTCSFPRQGFRVYWNVIGQGLSLTLNTDIELSIAVGKIPTANLVHDVNQCKRICQQHEWGGFAIIHNNVIFLTASATDLEARKETEGHDESTLYLRSLVSTKCFDFPKKLPPNFPTFASDTGTTESNFLANLPTVQAQPCWALLRSMDRLLRAQEGTGLFDVAVNQASLEALADLGTADETTWVSAVLALRLLRRLTKVAPTIARSIAEQILACVGRSCELELPGKIVVVQRECMRLLHGWLEAEAHTQMVNEVLTNALSGTDIACQRAAMYVVAAPRLLHGLGPVLIDGDCSCSVISVEPPKIEWEFVKGAVSPGHNLEHVDGCNLEKMKGICLSRGGEGFTTDGWIKERVLPRSDWESCVVEGWRTLTSALWSFYGTGNVDKCAMGILQDGHSTGRRTFASGMWIWRMVNVDKSAMVILREGGMCLETVPWAKLQPVIEQCQSARLTSATRQAVVRASAKLNPTNSIALALVLQNEDSVKLFLSSGLARGWIHLAATKIAPSALLSVPRSQRSNASSTVRYLYARHFEAEAQARAGALDDKAEVEANSVADALDSGVQKQEKNAAGIVAHAARKLCVPEDFCKDLVKEVPGVPKLLQCAVSLMQSKPSHRVVRLNSIAKEDVDTREGSQAYQGGLRHKLPNQKAEDDGRSVCTYLEKVRDIGVSCLVCEAMQWERQSVAFQVVQAVLLSLGSELASEKNIGSPQVFAQLCVNLCSSLEDDPAQGRVRDAILAVSLKWPALVNSLAELALANLLGSLAGRGRVDPRTYESEHPYRPLMDDTSDIEFPGATKLRIEFDPSCRTEREYDKLIFQVDQCIIAERHGDGQWEALTIEGNRFQYRFVSDGGTEFWGYRFTVSAEGLPPVRQDLASRKEGLWLMDLLLDIVCDGGVPGASLLRPEFAALLFAHVENGNRDAMKVAQRFVNSCGKSNVALDWTPTCELLTTMMQEAMKHEKEKGNLQDLVALLLSLPQVRPMTEPPRFVPAPGVLLVDEGVGCFAKSGGVGALFCTVAATESTVIFRCAGNQDAWVGVVPHDNRPSLLRSVSSGSWGTASPQLGWADDCRMMRFQDGLICVGLGNIQDAPGTRAPLQEICVTISEQNVTFDGGGLFRALPLPLCKWSLAACLAGPGASLQVLPQGRISNTSLSQHRLAIDSLLAVAGGIEWPDEFASQVFEEWWKTSHGNDIWSDLCQALTITAETSHPLSLQKRDVTKISIPEAKKLTLHFSDESRMPPGSVILVTLDEAGKNPADLTSTAGVDAACGAVNVAMAKRVEVDAPECFLHSPSLRPLGWEAVPNQHGFKLGGNATLLFVGEEATINEQGEANATASFMVHQSQSALSWLSPGVLAGEISLDFMAADMKQGNVAIGVSNQKFSLLEWSGANEIIEDLKLPAKVSADDVESEQEDLQNLRPPSLTSLSSLTSRRQAPGSVCVTDSSAETPVMEVVPQEAVPSCPRCGESMEMSSYAEEPWRCSNFPECDSRRRTRGPERWLCRNCCVDYCTTCYPKGGCTCPHGHLLMFLGNSQNNGWSCDGMHLPGGCRSGITGFGQTDGMNRHRCQRCDYDLCGPCYASRAQETGLSCPHCAMLLAPGILDRADPKCQVCGGDLSEFTKEQTQVQELTKEPADSVSWWWRCDGAAMDRGNAIAAAEGDMAATFGAGDTLSLLITTNDRWLRQVECRRNGKRLGAFLLPDILLSEEHDTNNLGLFITVAVRSTTACVSLLPYPHYHGSADSLQMAPLTFEEETLARTIFCALDADSNGSLDKHEIAVALGGCRKELFAALDADASGKVSVEEWLMYLKHINKSDGRRLFLESFRKKLAYIGRDIPAIDSAESEAWGFSVRAEPRGFAAGALACYARQRMSSEWARFMSLAHEGWTAKTNDGLLKFLAWRGKQKGTPDLDVDTLSVADLQDMKQKREKELDSFTQLSIASDDRVLARYLTLQALNRMVYQILPYCDFARLSEGPSGRALLEARNLLFDAVKRKKFKSVLESTFAAADVKRLELNRAHAVQCKDMGDCDNLGEKMLFAQAALIAEQTFSVNTFRARNRAFEVKYAGEDGVDAGGLYNDFFSTVSMELMSKQLPLLIPTPNARSNSGEHRDFWTLNPVPITSTTKRMLCFLGQLMGLCVRRGDVLPLSLSPLVWKLLVGEAPVLADLEVMDAASAEIVKTIRGIKSKDMFDDCFGDLSFLHHDSAGQEKPLLPDGAKTNVTFETAPDFAEKLIRMRFEECKEQIAHIRASMATVIPMDYVALWSWQDLQLAVCGSPEIDIQILKKKVHYENCSPRDERVVYLWQLLEDMSQEDRQSFLSFCWGRSRLPPMEDSPLWGDGFKITGASDLPADRLPRAHTCFFQIDMPCYSSFEVCKARVLYAIRNCRSMQIQ